MSRYAGWCCVVVLLCGCGASDDRVVVNGVLELDGTPLGGATVAFVSSSGSSMSSAFTDKDGKFTAKVGTGKNKVSVSKVDPNAAPPVVLSDEDTLMGTDAEVAKMVMPKDAIPLRYTSPATSGLEFDIQSGMQPLIIGVTSK